MSLQTRRHWVRGQWQELNQPCDYLDQLQPGADTRARKGKRSPSEPCTNNTQRSLFTVKVLLCMKDTEGLTEVEGQNIAVKYTTTLQVWRT